MGKISKRMKRMLAIILVEVIVASNVFVSYADESDGPRVIAEMTMEEADAYAAEQEEEQQEESSEEEITEETSEEEGAAEEGAGEDESPAAEGEEAGETETPGSEETPEASETPAEGSESGEGGDVIAVLPQPEEKTECICENKCTAEEYNSDCPVCSQAETAEDAEAFLTENCKGMEAAAEEPTQEPEEKEETVKAEIVEVDNSVSVTAVCKADGEVIEGSDDLTITVDGVVNVPEKAPTIEGYTFSGKVSLENGDSISQLKKETTEEKEESDVDGEKVITKITKTTSMSYSDGTEWKALSEDITIVFEYTKDETATEETAEVKFTASYVDLDGNAIEGYESKPLTFENTLDLTKEPEKIENYKYVEAKIDGKVVSSINKKTETDEDGKEITSYYYTTAGTDVEVTADKEIIFVYEAEAKEVVITLNVVDEEGLTIEGYAETTLPEFENELALDDPEKAPVAVEGYIYKEATVNGNAITALVKETSEEAKASGYSYVTETGESVAIEEDTEITLAYEEEEIVVAVDASVVDEFGDAIADKYTGMDISKIFDGSDELVLDDPETPPVAKVQVRKSLFKVIKYTYVKATVDKEIITGLKREVTKDTAELKDKKKEYIYSYTTDGETWTKIKKDTTVIFEYTDGKKSVYTYEDANVLVTATLQHANAIPDDAEFVVTPVTSSSSDYNYDAYMNALNKNADKIDENADSKSKKDRFNEKNTLLYDIAFLAAPVDENGETIEGELVEYQPAEGMVNISVQFKQKQLEKDLKAEKSEDVTVVHMPLSDSAKEANATTAGATGISASDIQVEIVADSTSVSGEQVDFNLSDFSVVVFALNTASDDAFVPGTTRTYEDMLGSAKNIGLVANEITLVGHLETNLATASLHGYGPLQAPRNEGNAGETYIGAYDGSGLIIDANSSGAKMMVYTTLEAARNFGSNTVVFDQNGNITQLRNSLHLDTTSYTSSQIASMVSAMITQVRTNSTAAFAEENAYDFSKAKNDTIDIAGSNSAAGTYYVNFDAGEYKGQHLRISINSDQNVVLNIPDTSVSFGQFTCTIDGNSQTTQASTGDDPICQRVIFNCPNATYAQTSGVVSGTFVVPNATFENNSVAAGWLVANEIAKVGGQEWHCVYHGMPEPVIVTDQYQFSALKKVNNATPATDENNKFTFSLYKLESDGSETLVESKTNNGENVEFSTISTGEQAGTFWYVIRETGAVDGYTIDATPYYAKVVVEERTADNSTEYVVTSKKYYRDAQGTAEVGTPTFNNTKIEKGSIAVTKTVSGTTTDKTFYFVLKDSTGALVSYNETTVFSIKNSETVTIRDLAFGSYTLEETDANGNAVVYSGESFPYTVTYTSQNISVSTDNKNATATITNTYTPSKVSAKVIKVWDDAKNQDGKRPASLKVVLMKNGVDSGEFVTLNAGNNWTATVSNLDEYTDGVKNVYTWAEDQTGLPEGYTLKSQGTDGEVTTITNGYTPSKVSATVKKVWDDNGNQDGLRPGSIDVVLKKGNTVVQTVTLSSTNNWTATVGGLDEYTAGVKNVYAWEEDEEGLPDGYELTGQSTEGTVTTITNSHTPSKVSVTVKKAWNDAKNQDGKRPETINVVLKKGNETVQTVTLSEANSWTVTVSGLDEYTAGVKNEYSWAEDTTGLPEGYTLTNQGTEGTVTTITNSYTPGKISATVKKVWDDAKNQDGKRPESINVVLKKGNVTVQTVTLSEANGWTATVSDLDEYTAGVKNEYSWAEDTTGLPEGYSLTNQSTEGTITTITNSYTPSKVSATVKKVWDDAKNQDGKRPDSIDVVLKKGSDPVQTVTLNEDNNWTVTVGDLDEYTAGVKNVYSWAEDTTGLPSGYTLTGQNTSGIITTITNSYTPSKVSATVKKVWNDAQNQDGKRPESINVVLKNGETVVKTVTLSENNNWMAVVGNLNEYTDGVKNVYSWAEDTTGLPEGYSLTSQYTEGTVTTITNSYTPGKVSATVTKVWDDNDNQDGLRPGSINVVLKNGETEVQTVTLDAANNWTVTINDLAEYTDGVKNVYTWEEDEEGLPDGYELTGQSTEGTITTITNSHTPSKVSVTVKKVWDDAKNQDGKRPESIKVVLKKGDQSIQTVTLTAANSWTATVNGLDEYTAGVKNEYSWAEDETGLPEGYTLTNQGTEGTVTTITNSYTPGKVSATVKKEWDDAKNQDGKRPESINVVLKKGNETVQTVTLSEANNWTETVSGLDEYTAGVKNEYSWAEDESGLPNGYSLKSQNSEGTVTTITNSYTPGKVDATVRKEWDDAQNQDGKRPESIKVVLKKGDESVQTVTLSEANGWTATVSGLDEYTAGVKNEYSWAEDTTGLPEGYTLTNQGTEGTVTTITNSYTPGKVSATVKKVWDDAQNQDNKRPESITVVLKKGNETVKTVTLSEANGWTETVNDLDEYTAGVKNEYSWVEDTTGLPEGYSLTSQDTEGTVTTITNSYTPGKVSATVKKEWDDAQNQDGKRPESIKVVLKKGNETVKTVTLSEANGWTATVSDLDEYTAGAKNKYSWAEDTTGLPEGYTLTNQGTEGTVTTITNSYTPGKVSATVKKEWDDAENQDGKRPESITVVLKKGNVEVKTVTLNKSNGWTETVSGLDEYTAGVKNEYSWAEDETGLPAGYSLTNQGTEGTVTTITNSYAPGKVSATVKKVWDDAKNQDGKRPESINVVLKKGNETVQTVTLSEANGWTETVNDLDEYTAGVKNEYSWAEDTTGLPEGYTLTNQGTEGTVTTITNSYTPGKVSATVKKVWDDAKNQDGKRPESINVVLKKGNETVQTVTLSEANSWTETVSGLDEYTAGVKNEYSWAEDTTGLPEGYILSSQSTEGTITTITNSYTPGKVSATVKKVWDDAKNQDGKRPESIKVVLKKGNETVQTVTLSEANSWTETVSGLDEYTAGVKNEYSWAEDTTGLPEGYTLTNQGTEGTVTTITNSYTPGKVSATVKKEWDDAQNQDNKRPESITVVLKKGNETVQTVTLSEANNWTETVNDLDEYTAGVKNEYSWAEDTTGLPEGYTLTNQGTEGTVTTITNSYTPGKVSATVKKVWDDAQNQDNKRPESIKVVLKKGNENVQTVTLSEANSWTETVSGLDEYTAGVKNEYSWAEDTTGLPAGYTLTSQGTEGTITTITNSYTPGKVSATVKKEWDDAQNQDGKRPEIIKVVLRKNNEPVQTVILSEANSWTETVSDLDEYTAGVKNEYSWAEDQRGLPEGYTLTSQQTEGTVTTITNSYVPEKIDIEGTKTWDDEDNKYEARPSKIVIHLYADDKEIDERTIEPDESGNWSSWKFENLDKYKDGKEIKYTISEDKVTDYTAKVEGYDVINSYTPDWTEVTVTKEWDDEDNQDGLRPTAILVQLYEDKLFDKKVGDPVQLDVTNNWTYTWKNLPKSRFLGTINYTVKELGAVDANGETVELTHYTSKTVETTINNVVITNSHIPETVELSGKKEWDDADNQDGLRPESITIRLYADGEALEDKIIVVKPDEKGDWAWSFKDLPKYKTVNGVTSEIVYTITEDVVTDYETEIKEEAAENGKSFIVTNTHKPEVISINGTKTWDDADNQDNLRPESITINLFANGEKIAEKVVTQSDNWSWSFENLPKFEKGVEIVYLITEDVVEGYSAIIEGYDVINRHTPGKTSRTVTKVWRDSNNRDKIRPESISVQLYADGEAYGDAVVLNAGNKWSYTWENLDEKRAGKLIVYTVAEIGEVKGYTTSYSEDTFVITNSHTPRQEPTPTPDSGETPTPGDDTETPPGNQPTPSPTGEVLGAKRVEEGGAVLGARRGPQYAVLGKRRRPQTGDSMALILWAIALGASAAGAVISLTVMHYGKKRED